MHHPRHWANLKFSSFNSPSFASVLNACTSTKPRFFFPFGTLYCKHFVSHFGASWGSNFFAYSFKSRTISGHTAIKSRTSSRLTALLIAASGRMWLLTWLWWCVCDARVLWRRVDYDQISRWLKKLFSFLRLFAIFIFTLFYHNKQPNFYCMHVYVIFTKK